jgi:hypothetical protein
LLIERERRTDAGAATRRAVDPQLPAERGDPIRQATQTASFRPGTSDSIVAYVQVQAAVLDACGDGRASSLGVFGQVGQRFGDHEVRVGLDLGTEPVSGHIDGDRQPQPLDQLLDTCRETVPSEDARKDALGEFAQLCVGMLGVAERLAEELPRSLAVLPALRSLSQVERDDRLD